MISFGNAASSHSGLIPLKTPYKKREKLFWAIASKKNFIYTLQVSRTLKTEKAF